MANGHLFPDAKLVLFNQKLNVNVLLFVVDAGVLVKLSELAELNLNEFLTVYPLTELAPKIKGI
jgi:hypothetical protein